MASTKELLQQRFAELSAAKEAIEAKSGPLRAQRDQIKNEAFEKSRALDAQIAEAETGLVEISKDLGTLSRALGGRSMSTSNAVR